MPKRFQAFAIAALLAGPALAVPARAQVGPIEAVPSVTTRPAPPAAVSTLDAEPLFSGRAAPRTPAATATSRPAGSTQPSSLGINLGQMFVSLGIVLALIGGLYWIMRRLYGGAAMAATTRVVKVLSRTPLAPRQQAMLLQVGRRVIVVGDSNGTLSQLAQITDADEVAELLGQLQGEQMQRAASFGNVFRRNQKSFDEPAMATHGATVADLEAQQPAGDAAAAPDDELARQRSELTGLLEKVRSLRGQIDR